ncbi:MAG: hypothetical protein PHE60_09945 [Sulfurospirillaceae bacterium]|nr:hypothetical protein [Sulfurospirillaceae bacterium]
MLLLLPLILVIFIVVGIDYFYFSDTKPQNQMSTKEMKDKNTTSSYLNKYIKK